MEKETQTSKGTLNLTVRDERGEIKESRDITNTITNDGLAENAALWLSDVSGTAFDYIAIGTGTKSATASDTALETETQREPATGTQTTTSVTDDTAQLVTTFSFTGSAAITESGVFNASSAGTMYCRTTFSAINVSNGDTLEITWNIQFS